MSTLNAGNGTLTELLASPLTLPCGLVLPNRLVKAAMEELMGPFGGGDPSAMHCRLHQAWAEGGWGLLISGNVQVSGSNIGFPLDVVAPSPSSPTYSQSIAAFRNWATASHSVATAPTSPSPSTPTLPRTPSILQLNHTGRQSMRLAGRPPWVPSLCPSATPLAPGAQPWLGRVAWGTPRAMDEADMAQVVSEFRNGARVAKEAGWDGVQVHAAHGYLLAQWLSPNINVRTDEYGGSVANRSRFLLRVIDAIRAECAVESGFCVGVKLNSSDFVKGGLTEEDALETVKILAEHGGVDFIEVSGGSYENAVFTAPPSSGSDKLRPREAFFQSFASSARALVASLPRSSLSHPPPAILVTGGLRSRPALHHALASGDADLTGLARPAAVAPRLPVEVLLNPAVPAAEARAPEYVVRGGEWVGRVPGSKLWLPGVEVLWHTLAMWVVAGGREVDLEVGVGQMLYNVWGRAVAEWVGRGLWARIKSWLGGIVFVVLISLVQVLWS